MRLYDSAWVRIEGLDDAPVQAFKNKRNAALFDIGEHQYDIDGRPAMPGQARTPTITALLTLSEIRELNLSLRADRAPQDVGRRIR